MKRLRLIAVLLLALITLPAIAFGRSLSISIRHLKLAPGERIVGVDLHLTSAMVSSIPKIPFGWNLTIDNDPSWDTSFKGGIVVGAAALDEKDLRDFVIVEIDEKYNPFAMTGEVIVTSDFQSERRISLHMENLEFKAVKVRSQAEKR
jgi:hypothetical protein